MNYSEKIEQNLKVKRDEADEQLVELLSNVIGRAKALRDVYPRTGGIGHFANPQEPVKIALVSMPIRITGLDGKTYPSTKIPQKAGEQIFELKEIWFDHFAMCVRDGGANDGIHTLEAWCDRLVNDCTTAIHEGARIVVINELGYPNFWVGRPQCDPKKADPRRKLIALCATLDGNLQKLAKDNNAIIVAGTCHDCFTFHNSGPIFFPDENRTCDHRKLTSANRVGEYIKPEFGYHYPVYNLGALSFSVLVCSDALDLNIFFQQLALRASNNTRFKPQMFFIPSWYDHDPNKTDASTGRPVGHSMHRAAEQLSKATDSLVVFVNHQFDKDGHAVYFCGERMNVETKNMISYFTYNERNLQPFRLKQVEFQERVQTLLNRRKVLT